MMNNDMNMYLKVFLISLSVILSVDAYEETLLAHWSFDSTSENTYYDVTGNGFDATSANLSVEEGVVGNALRCPGNGYKLMVANSKNAFNVGKFTIEAYFRSDSPISHDVKLFNFQNLETGIRNGYTLYIKGATGRACISRSDSLGTVWLDADATTKVEPGIWYHFTATFDGTVSKIYVNGILEDTLKCNERFKAPEADAQIACTRRLNGDSLDFIDGLIDEVKLYNYVLTEDMIKSYSTFDISQNIYSRMMTYAHTSIVQQSNRLIIRITNNQSAILRIVSLQGTTLYQRTLTDRMTIVNLDNIASGFMLYQLQNSGKSYTGRIIRYHRQFLSELQDVK